MVGSKHVFWQALLSAALIFGTGLIFGMWLEDARQESIEELFLNSEVNLLDSQLIGDVNKNFGVGCEIAKGEIFSFADRIFEEAILLEKYDDASQLSDNLQMVHKRYDLLRLMLWGESLRVKEVCKDDFHTVVYFYQYTNPDLEVKSEQVAFGRFLEDLKEKHGPNILLIPIAGDLNLSSVETARRSFGVNDFPAVVVDEEIVITELSELRNLEETIRI